MALVALSAGATQPKSERPRHPTLREAVRRTLAAGTARLAATVTTAAGPAIEVEGITSLVGPEAEVTATGPSTGRVDVRVTPAGAWLRSGGDGAPWTAIEPAAISLAAAARGWSDLLATLRPAPRRDPPSGPIRATAGGRPAEVELDGHGRIRRLVVDHGPATLDLRLRDHGLPLHVEPP